MFQQNHLVSWIIHFLNSWEISPILPTLKERFPKTKGGLNGPLFF